MSKISFSPMPDFRIAELATDSGMIKPFIPEKVSNGVISFGVGYYGYDIRIADEFKFIKPRHELFDADGSLPVLDPKCPNEDMWDTVTVDEYFEIPPLSFVLAKSIEFMDMPDNVIGLVLGKSTYARLGVIANFTPLEPGWRGYITIELFNGSPLPAKIYTREGIAQIIFFEGITPTRGYTGKYQNQPGIMLSTVEPPMPIAEAVAGVGRAADHFRIELFECECGGTQTARADAKSVVCVRCGKKLKYTPIWQCPNPDCEKPRFMRIDDESMILCPTCGTMVRG